MCPFKRSYFCTLKVVAAHTMVKRLATARLCYGACSRCLNHETEPGPTPYLSQILRGRCRRSLVEWMGRDPWGSEVICPGSPCP